MKGLLKTVTATAILAAYGLAPAQAGAASAAAPGVPVDHGSLVTKAQVGVYFDYGRPRYYRPHYYRPYYGYRYYDDPPPTTYYETRPYVVERAPPPPPPPPRIVGRDPDAVARCASRFRSFNVNTGTYITLDGEERLCPYLR